MPTAIKTKAWTDAEIQYLKENYETKPLRVIAKDLGKSRSCVWRHKKLYLSETVTATPNEQGLPDTKKKPILKITVDREEEKIMVFVQSNKAFEDYLKQTREIKSTRNLWGLGVTGKFYNRELISTNDNINRDIISLNQINFAVLRMRGISKGITIESRTMISEEQLATAVDNFIKKFKTFYKSSLNKQRVLGVLYDEDVAKPKTKPSKPVTPTTTPNKLAVQSIPSNLNAEPLTQNDKN